MSWGDGVIDGDGLPVDDPADKPSVYIDNIDGVYKPVYRASSLYGCKNALLAARLGLGGSLPPEWLQQRFDAGHDHEPLIIEKCRTKYDFQPYGFQHTVEVECGDALIRGHVDFLDPAGNDPLVTHLMGEALREPQRLSTVEHGDPDIVVVDAKALSQSSFEQWKRHGFAAFPYYSWQQRLYVFGLNAMGLVMAVKNKNTDDMIVDYYPTTAPMLTPIGDIFGRVLEIERTASEQGETALFVDKCDIRQYPCPFWRNCNLADNDKIKIEDPDTLATLGDLAASRELFKTRAAEYEADQRDVEQRIVDLVGGIVASGRTEAGLVSTYHHTNSMPDWDAIAEATAMSSDEAKKKFNVKRESSKLSVRITPPRKKS